MSVSLTVNGVVYLYPTVDDEDWGEQATAWATAVTQGMLQKAGGSFTLTADVDFGANFGLKSKYYKSRATNISSAGILRLGNTEEIGWRDAANGADVKIYVKADDRLYYKNGANPEIDLVAAAGGNVTGPGSSTDNALARFDGVSGQLLQNSNATLSDAGDLIVAGNITAGPMCPVGTVILHYDFNGTLTLNPIYWAPCDGNNATFAGIGVQATPDMSGLVPVGFGTIGGGDNNTAPWATTQVGNSSNQINLAHTHTVASHHHSIATQSAASTSTDGAHVHSAGSLRGRLSFDTGSGQIFIDEISDNAWTSDRTIGSVSNDGTTPATRTTTLESQGSVASNGDHSHTVPAHDHTGDTGNTAPGTDSQLSATQDIQNRALRFRYYIRIK